MRTIETTRLVLRPFEADDIPAYARIRAKPEVMRYLPGGEARTATAQMDAERGVSSFAALWKSVGYGPWAVIDRASGDLLGHLGLRPLPDLGGETEILYLLDSTAWGRGLATEGARAARDFGVRDLGLDKLIGLVVPENIASRRVLENVGMRRTGKVAAFGLDLLRYEYLAPAGSEPPEPPQARGPLISAPTGRP